MGIFRKKPVIVEAVQFTGGNGTDVLTWAGVDGALEEDLLNGPQAVEFETSEGRMRAEVGHWVIRGVNGSLYTCTPENFATAFEAPVAASGSFGWAIEQLKAGQRVARAGWNGKGMWLGLQVPDEHSKMGHPYIYMSDVNAKLFPWNPNALDMLSEDWEVVS